jgi:hypothetical protein
MLGLVFEGVFEILSRCPIYVVGNETRWGGGGEDPKLVRDGNGGKSMRSDEFVGIDRMFKKDGWRGE